MVTYAIRLEELNTGDNEFWNEAPRSKLRGIKVELRRSLSNVDMI